MRKIIAKKLAVARHLAHVIASLPGRLDLIERKIKSYNTDNPLEPTDIERLLLDTRHAIQEDVRHQIEGVHHHLHGIKQVANLIAARRSIRKRIKVVFLVHHIEAWDSLADVFQAMHEADDFEPLVVSINRRFPGEREFGFEPVIHEKLSQSRVPHLRLGMQDSYQALDLIKAMDPDIIFRQSQWDGDVPPAFHTNELRFARLCYVPYGVLAMIRTQDVGGGERDVVSDSEWHRACWRIFYATDWDVQRITATSARQNLNVVCTGHPKVNRLIREGELTRNWPISSSRENAIRIIWSPHHSIGKSWNNFGLFPTVYKDMLSWAKSDPNVEIVFSQHPALLPQILQTDVGISSTDLNDFLAEWASLPNTSVLAAGNYAGVMQASNFLISDGLSFLMEYQFFNKPVLFLEREDHVAFSKSGERVIEGTHRVKTLDEAKALIQRFHAGELDPLAIKQRELVQWLQGHGNAVKNILDAIRSGITDEQTF